MDHPETEGVCITKMSLPFEFLKLLNYIISQQLHDSLISKQALWYNNTINMFSKTTSTYYLYVKEIL